MSVRLGICSLRHSGPAKAGSGIYKPDCSCVWIPGSPEMGARNDGRSSTKKGRVNARPSGRAEGQGLARGGSLDQIRRAGKGF